MSELKIPSHPLGYRCDTCKFWNQEMKQDLLLLPSGQAVPELQARASGLPTVGMQKFTGAPCQLFPKWELTAGSAYCWQHKAGFDPAICHNCGTVKAPSGVCKRCAANTLSVKCEICGASNHWHHETCPKWEG